MKRQLIALSLICFIIFSCTTKKPEIKTETKLTTILQAKHSRPLTDTIFESTPESIERGKYLVNGILHCFHCHTELNKELPGHPPVPDRLGSGEVFWDRDSTYLYAPNISSDFETGIGGFSDDMLARAIREGIGHDGRSLAFAMPWKTYRNLNDEDLASVITYLRTIPPVKNKIPARNIGDGLEKRFVDKSYPKSSNSKPMDMHDPVSRGKYLISLGSCMGCHTNWKDRNPGAFGGGQKFKEIDGDIFTSNISSDSTGIGSWSAETFIYVIKSGKGGTLHPLMPWAFLKNMTDEDLEAIYLALKSTKPVKHRVVNHIPETYCEVCKNEHGLGSANKLESMPTFNGIKKTLADASGIYIDEDYPLDTIKISANKNKINIALFGQKYDLVPIDDMQYSSDGLFAPVIFSKNKQGETTMLQFQTIDNSRFLKTE